MADLAFPKREGCSTIPEIEAIPEVPGMIPEYTFPGPIPGGANGKQVNDDDTDVATPPFQAPESNPIVVINKLGKTVYYGQLFGLKTAVGGTAGMSASSPIELEEFDMPKHVDNFCIIHTRELKAYDPTKGESGIGRGVREGPVIADVYIHDSAHEHFDVAHNETGIGYMLQSTPNYGIATMHKSAQVAGKVYECAITLHPRSNKEGITVKKSTVDRAGGSLVAVQYGDTMVDPVTVTAQGYTGILAGNTVKDEHGIVLLTGVYDTKVNVTSIAHKYADYDGTSKTVLKSADSGQFRIVSSAGTTGEQTCTVMLPASASGGGGTPRLVQVKNLLGTADKISVANVVLQPGVTPNYYSGPTTFEVYCLNNG